jgi:hypothetical protein
MRNFGVEVEVNATFAFIRALDLLMPLARLGLFLIDL